MKKTALFLLVALLTIFVSTSLAGVDKLAQAGMPFLKIQPDGRAAGMGEAYAGTPSKTAMAMFTNPAALGYVQGYDLSATTINWIADIKEYAGGLAWGTQNWGTFGVNVVYMDYGDLTRTVPWETGMDPNSMEQGFVDQGSFNVNEYAFGVSYARQISGQFSIGGNVKWVRQDLGTIDTYDAKTDGIVSDDLVEDVFAFDFGTLYDTGWNGLTIGMTARNFSGQGRYVEQYFELPLTMTIGVGMNVLELFEVDPQHKLNVAVDWLHPRDYSERLHVGAEYVLADFLALRGGYKFNYDEEGLTFGFGVVKDFNGMGFRMDYSYGAFGDFFGQVQRVSFALTAK